MKLTLEDLLGQRDFGLELLTGDEASQHRPVNGAHAIEIASPSRWLPHDWIMLTNGLRLRGRADAQRELVAELHGGGQTALGWGVGLVHQRVPQALLDEARARGFPVFAVPVEVPFREIISFVHAATLSDDLFAMRRVVSMQDYLMDALQLNDPEPVILERLGGMFEADVLRFAADGRILHAHGRTDAGDVLPARDGPGDGMHERTVGGRRVLTLPVVTEDRAAGSIVLVLPTRHAPDGMVRPVLRSAARLLGLVANARRIEAGEGRLKRAEILGVALDGGGHHVALDEHARAFGVTFEEDAHAIAWGRTRGRPVAPPAVTADAMLAVEAALEAARAPFLLASRDGWLAGVVQGPLDDVMAHLLPAGAREQGLQAGIGRPIRSLADAAQSATDARVALEHAGRNGREGIASYDDLDPASWLLTVSDQQMAARKAAGLLDPLRGHPVLLETLRCYFDVDMNVAAAAVALNVHRNTLRYRLARVEEILGMRLDSPRTIANVHIALLSESLP